MGFDLLIADGASMQISVNELMDYFYRNPDLELPEMEFSFRDYILHIRNLETLKPMQQIRNIG